jgi:hypothetical protein
MGLGRMSGDSLKTADYRLGCTVNGGATHNCGGWVRMGPLEMGCL